MSYPIEHLQTIATCAKILTERGSMGPVAAMESAAKSCIDASYRAIKRHGIYASGMTSEQADAFSALMGVSTDVLNGFVSPTIGSVRDYVLRELRERQ